MGSAVELIRVLVRLVRAELELDAAGGALEAGSMEDVVLHAESLHEEHPLAAGFAVFLAHRAAAVALRAGLAGRALRGGLCVCVCVCVCVCGWVGV